MTPSHDEEGALAHLVFSLEDATWKLEVERRMALAQDFRAALGRGDLFL